MQRPRARCATTTTFGSFVSTGGIAPPARLNTSRMASRTCVMTCFGAMPPPSRFGTEALDEEAMPCIEQLGPVDAPGLRVEHFRRLRRHLLDDAQDAARGSQLQVQFVEERLVRFELDGAESRRKVGGTKRLQFVNQGGLGFLGAGGDQAHRDAGRAPAVLADAAG